MLIVIGVAQQPLIHGTLLVVRELSQQATPQPDLVLVRDDRIQLSFNVSIECMSDLVQRSATNISAFPFAGRGLLWVFL
ncbi:MAG: hypothetical protein H7039_23365 [Bryobacteraceae bacterium]|nr:hypothetical protein [Bryobacteraceae bacterium]